METKIQEVLATYENREVVLLNTLTRERKEERLKVRLKDWRRISLNKGEIEELKELLNSRVDENEESFDEEQVLNSFKKASNYEDKLNAAKLIPWLIWMEF